MFENRFFFLVSSALLGIGLAFGHIFHVCNVFEFQTDFSELSKVERELILSKGSQYFFYYKQIVEDRNFDVGFNKVIFDNTTEYGVTINAIHRFNIVPEIFTGLLYLAFLNLTETYNLPVLLCDERADMVCNGLGDSTYFYLSSLWCLSGLTIFSIFMFATFFSRNILGGFQAVISYFTLHEHATSLHLSPTSRENFAFPFMLIQFFILSKEIAKRKAQQNETAPRNFSIIWDMALITTISIIYWQFSSIIFTLQLLVIFLLYETHILPTSVVQDYALSQMFANIFAYVLTNKNTYFVTSLHFVLAISLILHLSKGQRAPSFHLRKCFRNCAFLIFFIYICLDLLNKVFADYSKSNVTFSFLRLAAARLKLMSPTLISVLYESNEDFGPVKYETAKAVFNVFCLKNICLFVILFLGKVIQYQRDKKYQEEAADTIERAKNYVIEDYMEENRIKMKDLSNPQTEIAIQKCLDLLKDCNYDYLKYKEKKSRCFLTSAMEKLSFLADIKKLKNQINEKERASEQKNQQKKKPEHEKQDLEPSKETKESKEKEEKEEEQPQPVNPVYAYNFGQLIGLGVLQIFIERIKFVFIPFACVFAATVPSKRWFSRNNTHIYWALYGTLMLCTLINPGVKNIRAQYRYKEAHRQEVIKMLRWIETTTQPTAVFGGPIDVISAVQLITKRPIVNHAHIEVPEMSERTHAVYSIYSRRPSIEIHNNLSAFKMDYLIVSHDLCYNRTGQGRALIDFWDANDPEYISDTQLCDDLFANSFTSFLKVYQSKSYIVVRVFSENLSDFSDFSLLPSKFRSK